MRYYEMIRRLVVTREGLESIAVSEMIPPTLRLPGLSLVHAQECGRCRTHLFKLLNASSTQQSGEKFLARVLLFSLRVRSAKGLNVPPEEYIY